MYKQGKKELVLGHGSEAFCGKMIYSGKVPERSSNGCHMIFTFNTCQRTSIVENSLPTSHLWLLRHHGVSEAQA